MLKFKSEFLQKAQEKGFLNQCTNYEGLDEKLSKESCVAYWGTDPTGASMHIGHLYSLMLMRLFQQCGHKPIILLGGATAQIGDPSFKDKSRPMMSLDKLKENKNGIKKAIGKFISFDGENAALMVDNNDWLGKLNYMNFLGEIGAHFSVNRMLTFESVKLRLEKEEHMSFLEFNYMIMQGYDFYHLYKECNCTLQLCGADQWGNVVAGVELTRRLNFAKGNVEKDKSIEVFGLSTELLLDGNGKKMGKSEGNAIWVDEDLYSPFDYFQFFRNIDDKMVGRLLRVFTELSVLEIEKLSKLQDKEINEAKKILAFEATKICHGEEIAKECLARAENIFKNNSLDDLESFEVNNGESIVSVIKNLSICESGGEAKRLIKGGAVSINGEKIMNEKFTLNEKGEFKLSVGKKKHVLLIVK